MVKHKHSQLDPPNIMAFEEEFDDKVNQMKVSIQMTILKMIQSYFYFQIWKGFCFGQVGFLYKYK